MTDILIIAFLFWLIWGEPSNYDKLMKILDNKYHSIDKNLKLKE